MGKPWTYIDPNKYPKDAVRLEIGDTDQQEPLLDDAEITYFLNMYNNSVLLAAIRACEAIMSKYTRRADETVGSVRISFSQQAKAYQVMADRLRQRFAIDGDITPIAGGISYSDKQTDNADPDLVKPEFTKKMMQNRQIGNSVNPADNDENGYQYPEDED